MKLTNNTSGSTGTPTAQFETVPTPTRIEAATALQKALTAERKKVVDLTNVLRKDLSLAEFEQVITDVIVGHPEIWANLALSDRVAELTNNVLDVITEALGHCFGTVRAAQLRLDAKVDSIGDAMEKTFNEIVGKAYGDFARTLQTRISELNERTEQIIKTVTERLETQSKEICDATAQRLVQSVEDKLLEIKAEQDKKQANLLHRLENLEQFKAFIEKKGQFSKAGSSSKPAEA